MKKILFFTIWGGLLLGLHAYFVLTHAYIRFWWLDNVLHMVGGFLVAAIFKNIFPMARFFSFLFFIVLFGVAWEAFEFFFHGPLFGIPNARFSDPIWVFDTLKDIVVDIAAGILWWYTATRYNRRNV